MSKIKSINISVESVNLANLNECIYEMADILAGKKEIALRDLPMYIGKFKGIIFGIETVCNELYQKVADGIIEKNNSPP